MSAETSGSVVNFDEERAKVTRGCLNKTRADWLLYLSSGSLTEAVSSPGWNSDRLRNRFRCHRSATGFE